MQGVIYQNDKEYPRLLKQIGKPAPKQLYFRSGNSCVEDSHSSKLRKTFFSESLSPIRPPQRTDSASTPRIQKKGFSRFENSNSQSYLNSDIFENCLAVVGSRKLTSYGEGVIEKIVSQLAMNGITIVSGFMYGGDAAAHQATVKVGGRTIAVMPCGIDLIHPSYQKELYQDILKNNGLIVSEYEGEMKPVLWTYPQRNRIIAGMAKAVLVIEAGEKSGSLITANYAKKFKRKIFAVPGPITGSLSRGTNLLIKQGAEMVLEAKDILKYYQESLIDNSSLTCEISSHSVKFQKTKFFESLNPSPAAAGQTPACHARPARQPDGSHGGGQGVAGGYSSKNLFSSKDNHKHKNASQKFQNAYSKENNQSFQKKRFSRFENSNSQYLKDNTEERILDLLAREPMGMDELARELGMNSSELGVKISMMEIKGKIKQKSGKYYK